MLATTISMLLFFNINTLNMIEIRNLYEIAADSKTANAKLTTLLASTDSNDALLNGYRGAAMMMEANHVFNPITKLSRFKKGKQVIENAIKSDGMNVELRFIRLTIQTNVPSFLGYSSAIEADKKLLLQQLDQIKDKDLRNRITNYLRKINVWKNK